MWTTEEIENLVMLVQERREIYDSSLSGHSNVNAIDICWREIPTHFSNKDVKLLKNKWQILRDSYRQRKRDMSSLKSGDGAKPVKQWAYFECLTFLDPFLANRETTTNAPVIEEYVVEEDGTLNALENTEPGYSQESETNDILVEMSEDIQPTRSSTPCSSTSKLSRKRKIATILKL
ncbi:Alcohol dehydrogenase transcription factor Myb/SANT-like [Popillia japonica]|uniref:Alcohol dehydrogenase transcription factor Myb/SANT-like n=1 Tax=Popillia japonica TaxID=7064 RepID=A0AAW1JVK7_POPJA